MRHGAGEGSFGGPLWSQVQVLSCRGEIPEGEVTFTPSDRLPKVSGVERVCKRRAQSCPTPPRSGTARPNPRRSAPPRLRLLPAPDARRRSPGCKESWVVATGPRRPAPIKSSFAPELIAVELRGSLEKIHGRWQDPDDWSARELCIVVHAETGASTPAPTGRAGPCACWPTSFQSRARRRITPAAFTEIRPFDEQVRRPASPHSSASRELKSAEVRRAAACPQLIAEDAGHGRHLGTGVNPVVTRRMKRRQRRSSPTLSTASHPARWRRHQPGRVG